jgi:two-component system OmpR family sensor kinase
LKPNDPTEPIRKVLSNTEFGETERRDLLNQALVYANELREMYAKEKARGDHLEAVLEKMRASAREQLHQRQTRFATVAAHELRTPLTPLNGFLGLLKRMEGSPIDEPNVRSEYLDICLRQVGRLMRLVEDLAAAAQPDVSPELRPERLELFRSVTDLVAGLRESDRKRLIVEVPETLECYVDPLSLLQVLRNVTVNALQYSPEECPVVIAAKATQVDAIQIEIIDQGPGISPEEIPSLFQRFDERSPDVTGGLGVGLWLTRRLTESMGGTVDIQGHPAGGTIVRITLPRPEEET